MVSKRNWHKFLFDWSKLPRKWVSRLKNTTIQERNSPWGLKDCGGGGDCLFHCVSEALNDKFGMTTNYKTIRKICASGINESNFDFILTTYKLEKENNEFHGHWDPNTIKTIKDLQNIIKTPGNTYWGDNISISLMENVLKMHFLVFQTIDTKYGYQISPYLMGTEYKYSNFILIHNRTNIHFQLIGLVYKRKMNVIHSIENLPQHIKTMFNIPDMD